MMDKPVRKHPRFKDYDYSQNGFYFVTVCTINKACILSFIVGQGDLTLPLDNNINVKLTYYGKIVERHIVSIPNHYKHISVDNYVIMPNHIHMLLRFESNEDNGDIEDNGGNGGLGSAHPTAAYITSARLSEAYPTAIRPFAAAGKVDLMAVIRGFKTLITKELGKSIWQSSFYEHIIRDERDYYSHWQYIDDNPAKWMEDKYYAP